MTAFSHRYLQLAIFRLEEVCVRIQEGMEDYLRTAGMEKAARIEATFRWLRKRGVRICLLTNFTRPEVEILLDRLDWEVGDDGFIHSIILQADKKKNPIREALDHAEVASATRALVVVDTPGLLRSAHTTSPRFLLGVTSGSHRYQDLAAEPHHALLDSPLQLPEFLLRQLPQGV